MVLNENVAVECRECLMPATTPRGSGRPTTVGVRLASCLVLYDTLQHRLLPAVK